MSDRRDQVLAMFFSAVMVLSVIAIGGIGFVGNVAADSTNTASSADSGSSVGASPGETINFTNISVNVSGPTDVTFTAVNVSSTVSTDANISSIAVFNNTTGEELGRNTSVVSGQTNVTFDSPVTNSTGNENEFGYTVEVTFASDGELINNTALGFSSAAFNESKDDFGSSADLSTFGSGSDLVNVGNVSVQNFQQFNNDERTNFNLSVTTPPDNSNGVNESSISVALNGSSAISDLNQTNITVIDNGEIVSGVANDNGTNTDLNNGNVTYDIDVELPEREGDGYAVTLLGNVTDDGGNLIKRLEPVPSGANNISSTGTGRAKVNMTPDTLQVTPDVPQFANTDAASDSGASGDENATINVTVADRFGNGLNTSASADNVSGSVQFVGVASGTSIQNTSDSPTYNSNVGDGTGSTPFQFTVSNSFAGDVELNATDSRGVLAGDGAVQTFVAPVEGIALSTNRSSLPADGSDIQINAQLTDSGGNPIEVPNIQVVFSNAGGFSDAGASFRSGNSDTTDSSGVASVNMTANTAGQSFTVRGTEQKNTNSDTIQIDTTTGQISNTNTQFLFKGAVVNGPGEDRTPSEQGAVNVDTSHNVSVRVLDSSNNAVQGASVDYTLDGSSVASASSNSNGFANATITLPQDRITNAQLNASVGQFNASATSAGPARAQVNISTNATDATQLRFGSDARALPVGSSGTVDVEVVDEFGNINESVSQDVTLRSSDAGVLNFSGSADSNSQSLADNNGAVSFTVDTASTAGSATLTAFTGGGNITNASDTFSVNAPDSVEVTFDSDVSTSSSSNTKQIANLSAQLLGPDGSDLAVSGTQINFAQVSGSAAELNQSKENFVNSTNSNGVATIQVNATSETGDTTFRALANNGASGEGTITTTGSRNAINLTVASTPVTENNSTNVTASFVDSEGRVVPRTDSLTLSTTLGSVDSNQQSTTIDPDGGASVIFNYTADGGSGQETLEAIGSGVTGTVSFTVEEAGPPTATVTFDNQTVQNGSTSVNVASATFNGSEAFNIVVHQATDDNDDGTIQASEIGKKIGESVELDNGTETDITVNISKQVADDDNVSQLTENQTLVAMLHTTNTSDDDNIVHTAPITRDGTPVFDQAEITVEDEQTANVGGEDVPVEFTTENDRGERIVTANNAVTAIEAFLNDDPDVDADTAVSVIRAFLESD